MVNYESPCAKAKTVISLNWLIGFADDLSIIAAAFLIFPLSQSVWRGSSA